MKMDIKVAVKLLVKYVYPIVQKIVKSKINVFAKGLYERLYKRTLSALQSFENALNKCFETDEKEKLKKRIYCCELGLKFFEEIHKVLDDSIPDYNAAILEAKQKYEQMTGEEFPELEGEND